MAYSNEIGDEGSRDRGRRVLQSASNRTAYDQSCAFRSQGDVTYRDDNDGYSSDDSRIHGREETSRPGNTAY